MDMFFGIILLIAAAGFFFATYFQWADSFFMFIMGTVGSVVLLIIGFNLINGAL